MDIEHLQALAAREPPRVVRRAVAIHPLRERIDPGGILLTDFLTQAMRNTQLQDKTYRHVFGPPASESELNTRFGDRTVPADLRYVLSRSNGIHLWADDATGRGYEGLAPIQEWVSAAERFYAPHAWMDERYVVITYHEEGAAHVVLDLASSCYFLMDAAGPDTNSPVASNASEFLDWLWRTRIPPAADARVIST